MPEFISCAVELLRRGSARCDQLVAATNRGGGIAAVPDPTRSCSQSVFGQSALHADWTRHSLGGDELPQQIQMLDLILSLDQKLERLCDRQMEEPAPQYVQQQAVGQQRARPVHSRLQRRHSTSSNRPSAVDCGFKSRSPMDPLLEVKEEASDEQQAA